MSDQEKKSFLMRAANITEQSAKIVVAAWGARTWQTVGACGGGGASIGWILAEKKGLFNFASKLSKHAQAAPIAGAAIGFAVGMTACGIYMIKINGHYDKAKNAGIGGASEWGHTLSLADKKDLREACDKLVHMVTAEERHRWEKAIEKGTAV